MAKQFRHTMTVAPKGYIHDFPIDMLRYDSCFPDRGEDSSKIRRSMDRFVEEGKDQKREDYTVQVVHVGEKAWKPTYGRWDRFGWEVLDHEMREAF